MDMTDVVELRTGWPRPLCRAVISRFYRCHWVSTLVVPSIAGVLFFLLWMLGYANLMQWLEDRGLHAAAWAVESPLIGFTVLILTGMGAAFTGCAIVSLVLCRTRMAHLLRVYLRQPTCLGCGYPIAPEGPCPECGRVPPLPLRERAGDVARGA